MNTHSASGTDLTTASRRRRGLIALARQGKDLVGGAERVERLRGRRRCGSGRTMDAVRRALIEMERLAAELRTPLARYQRCGLAATIAVLEGRFDEASSVLREAMRSPAAPPAATNVKQWAGPDSAGSPRATAAHAMNVEQSFELVERFLGYNIYRVILCGVYLSTGARNEALPRARHPRHRRLRRESRRTRAGYRCTRLAADLRGT